MQTVHRIFFALWPSAEDAAGLARWAHAAQQVCGGRANRTENLHMTLAYLGETESARVDELRAAAAEWPVQLGTMTLCRYGHFAKPKVVWAGLTDTTPDQAPWLYALHDDLWRRLEPFGWPGPFRPYCPHITLLRKVGTVDLASLPTPESLVWAPLRCVLVASRSSEGGLWYEVLAEVGGSAQQNRGAGA